MAPNIKQIIKPSGHTWVEWMDVEDGGGGGFGEVREADDGRLKTTEAKQVLRRRLLRQGMKQFKLC